MFRHRIISRLNDDRHTADPYDFVADCAVESFHVPRPFGIVPRIDIGIDIFGRGVGARPAYRKPATRSTPGQVVANKGFRPDTNRAKSFRAAAQEKTNTGSIF